MELNDIIHALPALLGAVVAIALVILLVAYQIRKWSLKGNINAAQDTAQSHPVIHESEAINDSTLLKDTPDISKFLETQHQLEKTLHEQKELLRQVHLLVKNNLQIISGLLQLKTKSVTDCSSAKALMESQNLISSMVLVHEKLYQSPSFDMIDFGDYARSICHHLYKSFVIDSSKIRLNLEADNIQIDAETAIPVGFILTELFSNALKYAFTGKETGNISISLRFDGDWLVMIVADDGVGMPADFDIKTSDSLGMQLIDSLINQVHGQLEYDSKNGTRFIVVVPLNLHSE